VHALAAGWLILVWWVVPLSSVKKPCSLGG
jgi:hypothetical protein